MEIVNARCAGLDVHKATIVAGVRMPGPQRGARRSERKAFATTPRGLSELTDWLIAHEVTIVAMESTGVYWRPVYAVLERRLTVILVNARHVNMRPGRKTDLKDCEWLAQLLECGLLRASFVPPAAVRDVRDLTRLRKTLSRERGRHVNRSEKTLELAQIKIGCVIRKKRVALREALGGRLAPHYAFLLQQHLSLIDTLDAHLATLDARIELTMAPFADAVALVETMPGVATRAAQAILAETGVDMTAFPSSGHFASWARLCPGNHESAGKRHSTTTGKGATWLRATLQECAWAAVRSKKSYYRALYHCLKARREPKKAIVAVQHAMLVALWHMLTNRVRHHDLGINHFDHHDTARVRRHHVRRLEKLGYEVVLKDTAA